MVIADSARNAETQQHLERLADAAEYLQSADPREFTSAEYAEIEEAILKVWVWVNLRRELQGYLFDIKDDVRECVRDLVHVCQDTKRYVNRTRYGHAGRGAGRIACGRYFTQFYDKDA